MKTFLIRWTCVLFFVSMGIFHGVLRGAPPRIVALQVKDAYPGDIADGCAEPGERISVSISAVFDFIPGEAFITCDSDFVGIESARTRFAARSADTLVNSLLEPMVLIKADCPTDIMIPFSLIYKKDTTYDTLNFEIHTVGALDSCYLDDRINKPGRKAVIRLVCGSTEGHGSGYGSVVAVVKRDSKTVTDSVALFDDGKHLDGAASDGHFANSWWTLSNAHDYDIDVVLRDTIMDHSYASTRVAGFTTRWFTQTHPYIIVADPYDNSPENETFNGIREMMDTLDLKYDAWNIWYRGFPDSSEMSMWGIRKSTIIWATNLGGTIKHSTRGKALIRFFLEKGGNLFLATPYLGSYISDYGARSDSLFLEEMLSSGFISLYSAQDSTKAFALIDPLTEQVMDTFTVSLSLSDSGEFASFIDVLEPREPASLIVKEWSGDGAYADFTTGFGLKIEKDDYRAIYLSFSVDDIEPFSLRKDFFGACLEWITTETADSFAQEPILEEDLEFAKLSDPYPNPFLKESTIPFSLLYGGEVDLVICDLTGRTVKRLIHSSLSEGNYYAVWDGKDEKGEETAVGYYFVRLAISATDRISGEEVFSVVSKKMLKLRK
jgi:hypothetical protein